MTLTSEVQVPRGAWADDGHRAWADGRVGDPGAVLRAPGRGHQGASFDSARLGVLLEDAVFAEWATETAERYHVSALDALGVLAEALARDGMSRATASTERARSSGSDLNLRAAEWPRSQRSSTSAA